MSPLQMTMAEIRERGLAALMKELGPVGYVRFMQEVIGRRGDYTRLRRDWIDQVPLTKAAKATARRRSKRKAS